MNMILHIQSNYRKIAYEEIFKFPVLNTVLLYLFWLS